MNSVAVGLCRKEKVAIAGASSRMLRACGWQEMEACDERASRAVAYMFAWDWLWALWQEVENCGEGG